SWCPVPVRLTVRLRSAAEVPPLHATSEPAPARRSRHVDEVALIEQLDAHLVADAVLAFAEQAKLAQQSKVAQLLQVTARRLVHALPRPIRHLHRFIAVLRRGLELRDHDGTGLDDGDAVNLALLVEDLRHSELASQ